MKLHIHELNNNNDFEYFAELLKNFDDDDPFIKIRTEHAKNIGEKSRARTYYFLLSNKEKPLIIMTFHLRKIIIDDKETPYYDIISPYGYNGPLFNHDITEEILSEFWFQIDQWYQKNNIVTEFIRFHLNGNHRQYSGTLIPTLINVKGHILEEEIQCQNFKAKVRNNYRRAVKEALQIKIYQGNTINQQAIEAFYEIYIETMRRNNADNYYYDSLDYFKDFILFNKLNAILVLVYKDEKAISTELILNSKDSLYSFLGGTLAEYFELRPNDFLKVEMINWARKHGYKYYILGGGKENGDGLYKYKKSFFPHDKDVMYYTGRKIINKEVYKSLVYDKKIDISREKDLTDITHNFFPLYRS